MSYTVPGSGSKLQDALGNAAAALTDEAVTNDTAKPTVVIASAGAFPTKDAFAVTITFSEAVTGFAVEEIEVTEGAASNFSGSGTVYEIEVTPAADYAGDVTVTVAADAAEDSNGVGNASASKAFAVDAKGPVLDSATVAGNTLVLTYDEALGAATPAASAYTVTAGPSGSLVTVNLAGAGNPVTVSGRTVTLTLATAVAVGVMWFRSATRCRGAVRSCRTRWATRRRR